jgi:hypothetical protein
MSVTMELAGLKRRSEKLRSPIVARQAWAGEEKAMANPLPWRSADCGFDLFAAMPELSTIVLGGSMVAVSQPATPGRLGVLSKSLRSL